MSVFGVLFVEYDRLKWTIFSLVNFTLQRLKLVQRELFEQLGSLVFSFS